MWMIKEHDKLQSVLNLLSFDQAEGNVGAVTNPMIDTASSTNWDGHAHRLPLTYSRARVAGSNSAIAGVCLVYAF